jgi:hypothetical protein
MSRYKCPTCGGNQYTVCNTAEGCIIEEDGDIGAEGGREEVEGLQ